MKEDDEIEGAFDTGIRRGGKKLLVAGDAAHEVMDILGEDVLIKFMDFAVAQERVEKGEQLTPGDLKALEFAEKVTSLSGKTLVQEGSDCQPDYRKTKAIHRRDLVEVFRRYCYHCRRRIALKRKRCTKCSGKLGMLGFRAPHGWVMADNCGM